MYINSPGGVVTSGIAIYDTMQLNVMIQESENNPPIPESLNS